MKKIFYPVLSLGVLLALASCASDEPLGNNQNDGSLSFTVSLPGQNTRFAEGATVDKLYYSVFDTEGNLVLHDNQDWPAGSLTTTVTLQLVANQSYDIVFFADNKEAESKGYSYNAETAQFSVNYGQEMVNNDIFDAFVKNEKGVVADGNAKTVTLTRPFAQLNIGTNDLTNAAVEKYGLSNFSSTLSIAKENVLSGINFLTGNTTAQTEDLSFAIAGFSQLPADAFPVSGYSYIEMNYLLVAPTEGETANLINATYTVNGKAGAATVNTLNLASTPVRQNYRTNIYGSLLTTQNNFNVEINPAFDIPSYLVTVTPESFAAALQNPRIQKIHIPEGTEIRLPAKTGDNYYVVNGFQGKKEIQLDGKIIHTGNPIYVVGGIDLVINGGILASESDPNANLWYGIVANNGGKLTLNNTLLEYNCDVNGSALQIYDGETILNGVTIKSDFNCVYTENGSGKNAIIKATDCTFIQTKPHSTDPAYYTPDLCSALCVYGPHYNATFTNCSVSSYGTACSISDKATVSVIGGSYASFKHPDEMSQPAIYLEGAILSVKNATLYSESGYNTIFINSTPRDNIAMPVNYTFENTIFNGGIYCYGALENGGVGDIPFKYTLENVTNEVSLKKPDGTAVTVTLDKKIQ